MVREPMIRLLLAIALATGSTAGMLAQRVEPINAARVRALAKEAEAEGKGDRTEIVLALDRKFRQKWGDFESFPVSIVKREDLSILLTTPFMTYRRAIAENLRMEHPLATTPWVDSAVITISPIQIGAPDIRELVVSRNGKPIAPLENRLKPMSFQNGNGQTALIHAGEIRFPISAFAPGAPVIVTATPAAGEPFVFPVDENQLQTLK